MVQIYSIWETKTPKHHTLAKNIAASLQSLSHQRHVGLFRHLKWNCPIKSQIALLLAKQCEEVHTLPKELL